MRWVGFVAACLGLGFSASAHASLLVSISKSQQQLTVSVDGAPTYRWPVSTGRRGYGTPTGNFQAYRLERVWFSTRFDGAPMPNSVFFHGGYAIHGTYEEARLGRPVSHGCVRLHRANAALLFELVRRHGMRNTRVVVSDGPALRAPQKTQRVSLSRNFETIFSERDGPRTHSRQLDDPRLRRIYREAGFSW